jgi:hypothetical protein
VTVPAGRDAAYPGCALQPVLERAPGGAALADPPRTGVAAPARAPLALAAPGGRRLARPPVGAARGVADADPRRRGPPGVSGLGGAAAAAPAGRRRRDPRPDRGRAAVAARWHAGARREHIGSVQHGRGGDRSRDLVAAGHLEDGGEDRRRASGQRDRDARVPRRVRRLRGGGRLLAAGGPDGGEPPHLFVLEVAASTGVPGLVGYCLFLVGLGALMRGSAPARHGWAWPCGFAAAVAVFPFNANASIYSPYWSALAWWFLGLAAAATSRSAAPAPVPVRR